MPATSVGCPRRSGRCRTQRYRLLNGPRKGPRNRCVDPNPRHSVGYASLPVPSSVSPRWICYEERERAVFVASAGHRAWVSLVAAMAFAQAQFPEPVDLGTIGPPAIDATGRTIAFVASLTP